MHINHTSISRKDLLTLANEIYDANRILLQHLRSPAVSHNPGDRPSCSSFTRQDLCSDIFIHLWPLQAYKAGNKGRLLPRCIPLFCFHVSAHLQPGGAWDGLFLHIAKGNIWTSDQRHGACKSS